jgi:hypothetical protein
MSRMTVGYSSYVIKKMKIFIYLSLQNGGHQLLPTTDSPTISACTTSTNLTNLEFQSSSTINKFMTGTTLENNLRRTISEIEPLQQTKIDMAINSTRPELDVSDEQLCQSEHGKEKVIWSKIIRQVSTLNIFKFGNF